MLRRKIFNWLADGSITIPDKKKRYFLIGLFGNEEQVSKGEFYCFKLVTWVFLSTVVAMFLVTIRTIWEAFRGF
jgi:hypothetical protein